MFTTGSKLFVGATVLSLVTALVFAIFIDGPTSAVGTVGTLSATVGFGLLAGINFLVRDGNAPALEPGIEHTANAARPPARPSGWPVVAAIGVAGLAVGAVSQPVVFKGALVVLLAALLEWTVAAWSERASDDMRFNGGIRSRIMNPLEFPVLAAGGLAAIIYAFSRIMLTVDKDAGRIVFIVIGALLLAGAFVIVSFRGAARRTVAGVCALGAFTLVGVGVASAVSGQRHIEEHPTPSAKPSEYCVAAVDESLPDEENPDHGAPLSPSARSAVSASVVATEEGVEAFLAASNLPGSDTLTVARGAQTTILFRNETSEPLRLTARLGTFGEDPEIITCTAAVEPGEEGFLSFKAVNVPAASSTPMMLHLGGNEDAAIELLVP